jgi:hypothetical protein
MIARCFPVIDTDARPDGTTVAPALRPFVERLAELVIADLERHPRLAETPNPEMK